MMLYVIPTAPTPERIEHELKQAHEELDAATTVLAKGHLNSAISSCYYACFHAARAILYHRGSMPTTHKGVVVEFSRLLVKSGTLTKEWANILDELHSERELADYHAYSRSISKEEVDKLHEETRRFVTKMEQVIQGERAAQSDSQS